MKILLPALTLFSLIPAIATAQSWHCEFRKTKSIMPDQIYFSVEDDGVKAIDPLTFYFKKRGSTATVQSDTDATMTFRWSSGMVALVNGRSTNLKFNARFNKSSNMLNLGVRATAYEDHVSGRGTCKPLRATFDQIEAAVKKNAADAEG